ncbi:MULTISPECIES: winged helix DNA-binding domain-containing protein [unclassified Dysgonomonas]|uniref:winged helix DNA-binding domain-containing protein n=1 Tax=unclassified Dysgonomonas TaxID=2630389 RepID=UPI0025B7B371|nr:MULTISPECIES: winged helix DNA-binding domain-containing protein [unclassified Dysgonomonas]
MKAEEILSLRLSNHQLDGTFVGEAYELVSWMGAIQAQDYNMAKWGIGIRIPEIPDQKIEEALNKGDILRLHILRPTWHFVSKDDIYWMLYLSLPRVKTAMRSYDKDLGLTESLIARTNSIIEKALQGNSLTRQELKDVINRAGIDADNRTVNHIMMHAELDGVVCNGETKGKKQTYALLQEKVENTPDQFDKEECLYKLAFKYFRSHGPATLQDFVWWSGLTTAEARQGIALIGGDFIHETINDQTYIFHRDSKPLNSNNLINLLPAFDEFTVSYKDRKESLHIDHHHKIITSPGIFRPAISLDGKVIGTWKKSSKKNEILDTEFFCTSNKKTQNLVTKAIEGYKKYLL